MDVFVGSRMHATIASFTTGVPTIPVAYSRKFAGFFENLGYQVLVDLTSTGTDQAVEATLAYVADLDGMKRGVDAGNAIAAQRIEVFTSRMADLIGRDNEGV